MLNLNLSRVTFVEFDWFALNFQIKVTIHLLLDSFLNIKRFLRIVSHTVIAQFNQFFQYMNLGMSKGDRLQYTVRLKAEGVVF